MRITLHWTFPIQPYTGSIYTYATMKNIVNLIFECLHLKRIKHEWPRLAGVEFPDSVAEHSLNAAQIGYILAQMEWADANEVASILIWHDLAETRFGDIHKVWSRYIKGKKEFEKQALQDQMQWIDFWESIQSLFDEYEERTTVEWIIAKDADYLEQAFQAKVWVEQWYHGMQDRIDNVWWALKTDSAKQLRKEMTTTSYIDRWQWLKSL